MTTPYTPQWNRVVETINRTLMEKVRSILNGLILGQELWTKAVDIACYLVNQSPSSTLVDKNPHEASNGNKHSLKYLKAFGCDGYVHVPKENKSKMDNKARKFIFIFVGYKDDIKGCKLWNQVTKKIVYSPKVVLREVKYVPKQKFLPKEKEKEIIEFELKDEEYDSTEQEEHRTPVLRRLV
jgi:hypothetical protein